MDVVVHADDFGRSKGVTDSILEAVDHVKEKVED